MKKNTNKDYFTSIAYCLITRKLFTYRKHASNLINKQIITASHIITLTHEKTMNERFNMIGLIFKTRKTLACKYQKPHTKGAI